ncbi:hypothetical protein AB0870_16955 [Microbacterium proteolyticum]|uniref:hypothetical protein n=1 Tax=Microbacterium proteolyticum TaxID=1572644 RepID=UPI002416795A|nr:hypothetical protein [Microbacterium proteolyticum]
MQVLSTTRVGSDFVEGLVQDLIAAGVSEEGAEPCVGVALTSPTVAMSNTQTGALLQAALVQGVEGDDCLRVVVRARLTLSGPRKGEVTAHSASVVPFDVADPVERARLILELAEDSLAYPSPASTAPREFTAVIAGSPVSAGGLEGEFAWNEVVGALGRVLRVDVRIVSSQKALGDPLPKSTETVVVLDPSFLGPAKKAGVADTHAISCMGRSLRDVFIDLAAHLWDVLTRIAEARTSVTSSKAVLKAGQHVFHRKIGSSATFDKFGDACKKCQHEESSYIRYHAAPKAEKGMKRIYENFEPSMLYHCGKGYTCGMYAVFAPANLKES